MKFFFKDFFSKCDQIRSFLRIWSHLLKKSLMKNIIFCAVNTPENQSFSDDFSGYKMGKLAKNKLILSLDETIYSISENYILGLSKDVL